MSTKAPAQRAHWHDAYDAQMALWRWYRTPDGMMWASACQEAMSEGHDEATRALLAKLWDGETGRLLDCDPIYISDEMCDLVDAARESFQPEPLVETDLMTPRGFLWFARPIELSDRYGYPLTVQAASWAREYASETGEKAVQAMDRLHSDAAWAEHGSRIRAEETQRLLDEGLMYPYGIGVTLYASRDHYLNVTNAERPDMREKWRPRTAAVPVVPFHATPWHFNSSFAGNEFDELGEETGAADWWVLLQTTFRLMQQRIAAAHHMRLHRSLRREAARRLGYEPEVVVVRLRREQGESHEPTGAEANYSHRFIVSGHWRNQWYPSASIHRQLWISPYVKGPEDKPLLVRPRRVYQWER